MSTLRKTAELISRLREMGFSYEEANQLRRIEMTFHRWDELECGDSNDFNSWAIERDETTGKPYMHTYPHNGKSYRRPVPDREKGAQKRLDAVMASHPEFVAYHQSDCRGAALYIIRKADLRSGESIDSVYNRGFCVAA